MQVDKSKVGQFFIYVGLILLVVFFVTDHAVHPAYGYFFAGFGLLFLGIHLCWRNRKVDEPNTARFRTLRKWREREAKRKDERKERKNR